MSGLSTTSVDLSSNCILTEKAEQTEERTVGGQRNEKAALLYNDAWKGMIVYFYIFIQPCIQKSLPKQVWNKLPSIYKKFANAVCLPPAKSSARAHFQWFAESAIYLLSGWTIIYISTVSLYNYTSNSSEDNMNGRTSRIFLIEWSCIIPGG